jgi:hypothetical protein
VPSASSMAQPGQHDTMWASPDPQATTHHHLMHGLKQRWRVLTLANLDSSLIAIDRKLHPWEKPHRNWDTIERLSCFNGGWDRTSLQLGMATLQHISKLWELKNQPRPRPRYLMHNKLYSSFDIMAIGDH